jgi:hypothetical protein
VKTPVEVNDRREARALQRALADPSIKAYVVIMGELLALPSDRARRRLLTYMLDKASDSDELPALLRIAEKASGDE